mmetsp:Transcript_2693/g.8472  ORF Transcript_2693/g.8472 Transcript_2693/m.8472 type:complete len:135 (+) Transcript_2693:484-888(+)
MGPRPPHSHVVLLPTSAISGLQSEVPVILCHVVLRLAQCLFNVLSGVQRRDELGEQDRLVREVQAMKAVRMCTDRTIHAPVKLDNQEEGVAMCIEGSRCEQTFWCARTCSCILTAIVREGLERVAYSENMQPAR